ncbi:MAG: hypothetical protein JW955_10535 [Sedimentisphaerales bacterium]|nr:hypothetical protein [Sedimentisphaerales bacterium]
MKCILLVLVAMLVASCESANRSSADKGQSAPRDEKYSQALEYYTLTHEQGVDPTSPLKELREKPASEIDRQTATRLLTLQEAIRGWRLEAPDSRVAGKDKREVRQIVESLFEEPVSRSRMVVKTYDLKMCERVTYQFYNKSRCFVNVMFYDRGPRIQAGLDLYLFKHDGGWLIVYRTDWIG